MAEPGSLAVRVGSGTLQPAEGLALPHAWTPGGVVAETAGTGAHLLHLAVATCVLNDVHREASRLGVPVDGVLVAADGGFDTADWTSTGITYAVELDSPAGAADTARLLEVVDEVAEIPRALRAGTTVTRVSRMSRVASGA